MKKVFLIAELLLGVVFAFSGLNGLLIPLGLTPIVPASPDSEFVKVLTHTN